MDSRDPGDSRASASGGRTSNARLPWGLVFLRTFGGSVRLEPATRLLCYRALILGLTFVAYTCYHLSRKPISVVKGQLVNCSDDAERPPSVVGIHIATMLSAKTNETNCTSFINEMNGATSDLAHKYLGLLDTSFLTSYAIFMFVSGFVAERVDLRYFLATGMVLSGVMTMLFGLGKLWGIHGIWYYILVQFVAGALQSTGWPGVVTAVANWFGKGKKGLIFGIWNCHTSIGNILGGVLAGAFVSQDWGLSFIVPGAIIGIFGVVIWFMMPIKPADVGLDLKQFEPSPVEPQPQPQYSQTEPGSPRLSSAYGSGSADRTRSTLYSTMSDEEAPAILVATNSPSSLETTPLLRPSDDNTSDEEELVNESGFAEDPTVSVTVPGRPSADGKEEQAMTFWRAFTIPGVVEFALSLFFAKLVSYTFLYWLPAFIKDTGSHVSPEDAANFATLFDVGGIVGGIIAGTASDKSGKPALVCLIMTVMAIPSMYSYNYFGKECRFDPMVKNSCYAGNIGLLMLSGLLVNGPYALITTAVSADLGQHDSIKGSAKALATVTAIIDGTGSIGAAVGPYLAGALQNGGNLNNVFIMLEVSAVITLICLARLVYKEVMQIVHSRRQRRREELYAGQT